MESYTNFRMEEMVRSLEPLMKRRDLIGYAAARNMRLLLTELTEFETMKDALIEQYGTDHTDEDGKPTGRKQITPDNPMFAEFIDELNKIGCVEHAPNLMKVVDDDVIGALSGQEIFDASWMIDSGVPHEH